MDDTEDGKRKVARHRPLIYMNPEVQRRRCERASAGSAFSQQRNSARGMQEDNEGHADAYSSSEGEGEDDYSLNEPDRAIYWDKEQLRRIQLDRPSAQRRYREVQVKEVLSISTRRIIWDMAAAEWPGQLAGLSSGGLSADESHILLHYFADQISLAAHHETDTAGRPEVLSCCLNVGGYGEGAVARSKYESGATWAAWSEDAGDSGESFLCQAVKGVEGAKSGSDERYVVTLYRLPDRYLRQSGVGASRKCYLEAVRRSDPHQRIYLSLDCLEAVAKLGSRDRTAWLADNVSIGGAKGLRQLIVHEKDTAGWRRAIQADREKSHEAAAQNLRAGDGAWISESRAEAL